MRERSSQYASGAQELPLRVTVLRPPPQVKFALQYGRTELVAPSHMSSTEISFDLRLRIGARRPNGRPTLLGPAAQGPPDARFVYVNSGTRAGQPNSCWDRRAKVPLTGITWTLIEAALAVPGAALEARIQGSAGDGGPACATVPILEPGWHLVPAAAA
jgi:hypothetical protein